MGLGGGLAKGQPHRGRRGLWQADAIETAIHKVPIDSHSFGATWVVMTSRLRRQHLVECKPPHPKRPTPETQGRYASLSQFCGVRVRSGDLGG